jgi:ubiquinol-cytochrome c reductase cytochrome c subunit
MLPLVLAAAVLVPPAPSRGAELYTTYCSSCHGANLFGSANAPSLRGVGLARVDFYLTTGRMPAAAPWIEIEHRGERIGQQLPQDQIRAIEAYVAPMVAGGPPIPEVIAGSPQHGRTLFEVNCEQCHGTDGQGGGLGGIDWVPSLQDASINQVAEAMRIGPDEMPQFGPHQLSQNDVDDIAAYVVNVLQNPSAPGGIPLRSTGPVPEGALGYLAIIVVLAFVFTYWRESTPDESREQSVRRDEGGEVTS